MKKVSESHDPIPAGSVLILAGIHSLENIRGLMDAGYRFWNRQTREEYTDAQAVVADLTAGLTVESRTIAPLPHYSVSYELSEEELRGFTTTPPEDA